MGLGESRSHVLWHTVCCTFCCSHCVLGYSCPYHPLHHHILHHHILHCHMLCCHMLRHHMSCCSSMHCATGVLECHCGIALGPAHRTRWVKKNKIITTHLCWHCHVVSLLMPAHLPVHNLISKKNKEVTYHHWVPWLRSGEEVEVDKKRVTMLHNATTTLIM